MTVSVKAILEGSQAPAAVAVQYTAPASTRTIIDKFTVTNPTGGAATFTAYLVASAGAPSASNTIISAQAIAPGTTYLCPELVGHTLNPGDMIQTFASAAATLTQRASGREVT